jgi:cell division protein FtsB
MDERAKKVEDLERDIAQTVEAQVRENGELTNRIRDLEDAIRSCIPNVQDGQY